MGRTSNKTPEQKIAELQAKLAIAQGEQAKKTYADLSFIQDLRKKQEAISEEVANAKPFISDSGPRSLSIRMMGAQLKAERYRLELEHNTLIQSIGGKIDSFLGKIMGEAITKLQAGESNDKVEAFITQSQKRFTKDNSEDMTRLSASIETMNKAIQACEDHSNKHTPKREGQEGKREFFRKYQNPLS
jgi:hypothetical protein